MVPGNNTAMVPVDLSLRREGSSACSRWSAEMAPTSAATWVPPEGES